MTLRASLIILILMVVVSGCASRRSTVYQDPSLLIAIEPEPAPARQPPAIGQTKLTPEEFEAVLRGFSARKKQGLFDYVIGSQIQPIFPQETLLLFADEALKGLRLTQPGEGVVFEVRRTAKNGLRDETSGTLALRGSLLYLKVDKFRVPERISYEGAEGGSGKDFDLLFEPSVAVVQRQEGFAGRWLKGNSPEIIVDVRQALRRLTPSISEVSESSSRHSVTEQTSAVHPTSPAAPSPPPFSAGPPPDTGLTFQSLQSQITELTESNQKLMKASSGQEEELARLRRELAETKQALADKVIELNRLKSKSKGKPPASSPR
jgi:hypothetical protein